MQAHFDRFIRLSLSIERTTATSLNYFLVHKLQLTLINKIRTGFFKSDSRQMRRFNKISVINPVIGDRLTYSRNRIYLYWLSSESGEGKE